MPDVRLSHLVVISLLCAAPASAQVLTTMPVISKAEQTKIFTAIGAVRRGKKWVRCVDDANASEAVIEVYRDINGDGRPEAVVVDSSSYCYGFTGAGYALVSRNAAGIWKTIDSGIGMIDFLKTKGVGGWPDMSIGGPGFCFPVLRWNGKAYVLHRHEYEGKRCKPYR